MKGIKHLLIAPPLIFFLAISVVPLVFTLVLSFTSYSIGGRFHWVGPRNYVRLAGDPIFLKSFVNTFLYVLLGVMLQYALGLGLSLLVHALTAGKRLVRLMIMLPFIMPPLLIGFVWQTIFDSRYGPLSALLRALHLPAVAWLHDPHLAFASIVVVDAWQWTPFMFLILFAGLRTLPKEPFEAARVDGASAWQVFTDLTFPMLIPASVAAVLLRSIEAFKLFDIVFYVTGGGPGGATSTVSLLGYFTALRSGNLGYGAAMSIVLLVTVMALATVLLLSVKRILGRRSLAGRLAVQLVDAAPLAGGRE